MNILGISAYYHDSSVCLIKDGQIIAAAEEERFNRKKHYSGFPIQALNYCLQTGNIIINDIDLICFYEKPLLKFSRFLMEHINSFPFSLKHFMRNMPYWLEDRLSLPLELKRQTGYTGKTIFIKHHLAHAASSFLASPFSEAAIITVDGVGEFATTTYGIGKNNNIRMLREIHYPHSLGLFYTAITTFLGFEANEGEGKVMGLASYGVPRYADVFRKLINIKKDGSFQLNLAYFKFVQGNRMYTRKLIALLGPERKPESALEQRHYDIAASLQAITEEVLIAITKHVLSETKQKNLCLAGGVFLNCVANSKIIDSCNIQNVFIQPAAGDSGGAIGSALYAYYAFNQQNQHNEMKSAYLGKSYNLTEIETIIKNTGLSYKKLSTEALVSYIAQKISEGQIIGWFQGKAEIGPRALGNRSILADPRNPQMQDILNTKIKHRETFRPYAPAILEEKANDYFELSGKTSPFMLLAPKVRTEKRALIPAVTHVDNTARVQTVSEKDNDLFYKLIKSFEEITGIPIVINTSFNVRGEPIVNTPQEAINCFCKTQLDILVIDNCILESKKS